MPCEDLYFGASRNQSPPTPRNMNPAITPSAITGGTMTVTVKLRNHGDDDSPYTTIELYRCSPTTTPYPATWIQSWPNQIVPAAAFPGGDGATPVVTNPFVAPHHNFTLYARAYNTAFPKDYPRCQPQGAGNDYRTDPLIAVRNVSVIELMTAADGPSARKAQLSDAPVSFAFSTGNLRREATDARLVVRPLDPRRDAEELAVFARDPALFELFAARRIKFAAPLAISVALGNERLALDQQTARLSMPFALTGQLTAKELEAASPTHWMQLDRGVEYPVSLEARTLQQTFLQVQPAPGNDLAQLVIVDQFDDEDALVGSLTLITITSPPSFF
jgi:hypothetical protein